MSGCGSSRNCVAPVGVIVEDAHLSMVTPSLTPRWRIAAAGVLLLAAWNLFYRLDQDILRTWDESLYATTAAEMLASGEWTVTTFHGETDYYNAKPPLNVWLIAMSFTLFGTSFASLRLVSALSAWLTIALVQWWCWRAVGPRVALAASLVLSTLFAFFFLHSARSGNADALFTLLIALTAFVVWRSDERPRVLVWVGPLLALSFLLKGMAVLLPLALALCALAARGRVVRREGLPLGAGLVLGAAVAGAWLLARYAADGGRFLRVLFGTDFVQRVAEPLDEHGGGLFYYLDTLQRDHYDWIAAGVVVLGLAASRAGWAQLRHAARAVDRPFLRVVVIWGSLTLLVPTAMSTKLGWYLNPFYPAFAIAVGGVLVWGVGVLSRESRRWPWRVAVAVVVLAAGAAEGKLLWYSYNKRSVGGTPQGLLLSGDITPGSRVYRPVWDHADRFVLEHMRSGHAVQGSLADFLDQSHAGDLLLTSLTLTDGRLVEVRRDGRYALYRRR